MSDLVPDLSWEEIATNIEQLKTVHRQTSVTKGYLEEIGVVNDALCQGETIAIRVAGHYFTCPPGELHPSSERSEEGCLFLLRKVVVEFKQDNQTLVYRITLQFWDSTHEREVLWGATAPQHQWETMVHQAQAVRERGK